MEMASINLEKLRRYACGLVLEAGNRIMELYDDVFEISEKDDQTPLTSADIASNQIIMEGLQNVDPFFPVISEESRPAAFAERRNWQAYWLVDPLDGTKEFIKHNDEFTVNIALIYQQKPVIGVIHAPALNATYFASRGRGAFKLEGNKKAQRIHVRNLRKGRVTIAGSRSHATSEMNRFLKELNKYDFIQMGSSIKFCRVAEGAVDLYPRLGPTYEWDSAAGQCIVEEAGGLVTDTRMRILRYNTKKSILNPNLIAFGDRDKDWSAFRSLRK